MCARFRWRGWPPTALTTTTTTTTTTITLFKEGRPEVFARNTCRRRLVCCRRSDGGERVKRYAGKAGKNEGNFPSLVFPPHFFARALLFERLEQAIDDWRLVS